MAYLISNMRQFINYMMKTKIRFLAYVIHKNNLRFVKYPKVKSKTFKTFQEKPPYASVSSSVMEITIL